MLGYLRIHGLQKSQKNSALVPYPSKGSLGRPGEGSSGHPKQALTQKALGTDLWQVLERLLGARRPKGKQRKRPLPRSKAKERQGKENKQNTSKTCQTGPRIDPKTIRPNRTLQKHAKLVTKSTPNRFQNCSNMESKRDLNISALCFAWHCFALLCCAVL